GVEQSRLKVIAQNIAIAFDLDNTPLMMQTIVGDNEINVIEFAARIGGGENYRIIQLHTGFDIIDSAIDSFLGNSVSLNYEPPTGLFGDVYIHVRPSVFGGISGYESLVNDGTIEYLNVFKASGTSISAELSSNNRVGSFLVRGDDQNQIFEKIKIALENIEVFDVDGKPVMRKEIYGAHSTIQAEELA
ncbi:MAG: hypothetical protein KC964_10900, partial [Candidatus Omnitrophica bacterium]|nr:hypothetical protein [Candidatus Omnitrophota bacterium]